MENPTFFKPAGVSGQSVRTSPDTQSEREATKKEPQNENEEGANNLPKKRKIQLTKAKLGEEP